MKQKPIPGNLLFRKLIENSYIGITLLDAFFKPIYRNPSALRIYGWEEQEQPSVTGLAAVHPEDLPMVENILQLVLAAPGSSKTCRFRSKHYQGHYIWLECNYTNRLNDRVLAAIVCSFRDVSKQKEEEQQLHLLESVIINTTDAVLITEAEPFDKPGPRILYVNEAFTKMTGYAAEEVIGKTPRILQGPKTDVRELARLSESIRRWEPCELTIINYKKNGEEFWVNFTLNPVADEKGWYTHWISIDRDVTDRKNIEIEKALLAEVSQIFTEPIALNLLLDKILQKVVDYGNFMLAEVWLVGNDKNKITLVSHLSCNPEMKQFYDETEGVSSFAKGDGLPGAAWASKTIEVWDHLSERKNFIRRKAAETADIRTAYGIPLISENMVIGVLVLGMHDGERPENNLTVLFKSFSTHFGAEIKRKQLEQDLDQVFNSAPDIIAIIGTDRYFKKVNLAMSVLMEYSREELLSMPMDAMVHPDELTESFARTRSFINAGGTIYFDNRFITKSGKVKWISWTATKGTEEGLIFCVGKDITDKKNLEDLLNKVTDLARIGGWEADLINGTFYWSKMTKDIHEVEPGFEPDLNEGIGFFKEESDRVKFRQQITDAIEKGTSFDCELQIETAKGNIKWVRVVGEPEFIKGKCVRLYGSFQDVDVRAKAEISANNALKERNVILESIGDAFFAVDKNWKVIYWNKMAEKLLGQSKKEILEHNLWDIFSDAAGSRLYKKCHKALNTGKAAHFEDYYQPLDKWYEVSAYPSVGGLSVYVKDISTRKLSSALLKESEKRYSDLFHFSPLPKWVFDIDTLMFLDVNKAAINNYGYSREEFLSMTIKEMWPPLQIPEMEKDFLINEKQRSAKFHGVVVHKNKNGELRQVDIQSNAIRYKGKRAKIVAVNDITERLNYIKAIEDQNTKLMEISWMQSHIIRAPLARIMGLIPLAVNEKANPVEKKKIFEFLETSAKELDKVIHNITTKTVIADYKGKKDML